MKKKNLKKKTILLKINNNVKKKKKKIRKRNWYHPQVWENNILSRLICWASKGLCKWQ